MKPGTLVHVHWIDSCSTGGWTQSGGAAKVTRCESVGWLVCEDSESLTVAGHYSPSTSEWNGVMTIPRVAVESTKRFGG